MPNIRYEISRLRTGYYLAGIQERYQAGKIIPSPTYVIWDSTRRCNLICRHCGAVKESYSSELSTEQIKNIVDQLADMHVAMFAVTGGEPLLRKDLPEILSHASQRGLKTGIATNGFLVDQSAVRWMKAVRVQSVQVSLDGAESLHNRIRGNELSFIRATGAIELLIRSKIPLVSVATTVTTDNISGLEELGEILHGLGVRIWRLALVMPIGRAEGPNGFLLDAGQLAQLLEFISVFNSKSLHIYLGENLPYLGEWERQIRNAQVICPIGFTACCIGVDGNVRGCPEQPDVSENREGSLLETSFQQIWQKGFKRYRLREVLRTDPNCNACRSNNDCYGGCWVMRRAGQQCIYKLLDITSGPN